MKLINNSSFRTEDLRAFITAGCQHMGVPTRGLVVECGDGWQLKWRPSRGRYGSRARPGRWMLIIVKHHLRAPDPGPESGLSPRERAQAMHPGRPVDGDVLPDSVIARGMAHVIEHECMHLLGVRHRQMTPAQRYFTPAEEAGKTYDWALGLGIRRAPVAEKVTPVVRLERARAARSKKSEQTEMRARLLLTTWQTRLKRAEQKVRVLRAKVRYYDRRQAAGSKP
jgi:hypothetical protein